MILAKDWENTRSTLTWIDTDNNILFTLMAALNENDILETTLSIAEKGYPEAYQFLLNAYEESPTG